MMFAFGDVLSGTTFKFEYSSFVIFKSPSHPVEDLFTTVLCTFGKTPCDDCSLGAETKMIFGAETNMMFAADKYVFLELRQI